MFSDHTAGTWLACIRGVHWTSAAGSAAIWRRCPMASASITIANSVAIARGRGLRAWTTDEWPGCPDAIPASYDTLLLAHVLEHLAEEAVDALLASYFGYLKPAAKLILICPQERGFASDASHVRWVDWPVLDRTARSIGFEPVRAYSFPFPRFVGRYFAYNEFVLVAARRPD